MAKRFEGKDIFDPALFDQAIKDARRFSEEFERIRATIKNTAEETKQFVKDIEKFDTKGIAKLDKAYKAVNKSVDENKKAQKELSKTEKDRIKLEKQLKDLTDDQTKENEKLKKSISETRKETKNLITIEEELGREYKNVEEAIEDLNNVELRNIKTKKEASEQNKALRLIVADLNPDIAEQAAQIKRLNTRIDENTEFQSNNSDEFVKSKMNVGNYTESVKEALNSTGLFGDELDQLGNLIETVSGLFSSTADDAEDLGNNTEGAGRAARGTTKSFRRLNNVLKASIIGAVVVAVASLGAAFASGRAGAIRMEKTMLVVQETLKSTLVVLSDFGSGLINIVSGIGDLNFSFSQGLTGTEKFKKGLNDLTGAIKAIPDVYDNAKKSVEEGFSFIDRRFDIQDDISAARLEIAELNAELTVLEQKGGDSSRSLRELIKINKEAAEVQKEIIKEQQQQAELEVELQQEAIRLELMRNKAVLSGREEEVQAVLNLAGERGKEVEFLEKYIQLQRDVDELAENSQLSTEYEELTAATENLLSVTSEGEARLGAIQQELLQNNRDLFEQNLDILLDVTDRNRGLMEQQVSDTRLSVEERKRIYDDMVAYFGNSVELMEEEFEKLAKENAEILGTEFGEIDFKFGEDGFELFIDGAKQSTEEVKALNERLQSLGFSEIPINRLREITLDATDAKREFNDINRELEEVEKNIEEISERTVITEEDTERAKQFNQDLKEFIESQGELSNLTDEQLDEILDKQEEFNDRREEEQKEFEERQLQLRKEQVQERINALAEGSEERIELEEELAQIEQEINARSQESITDKITEEQEERERKQQEHEDKLRKFAQDTADFVSNVNERISERRTSAIDDEMKAIERRESMLQDLAAEGNEQAAETLQNEQKRLAELEQERQSEQEAQARRELVIAAIKAKAANPEASNLEIISSLATLPPLVEAIPLGFYEGTENVEKALGPGQGPGGKDNYYGVTRKGAPFRFDGNERIMSPNQNMIIGDMTNEELTNLAKMHNQGALMPVIPKIEQRGFESSTEVLAKFDKLTKEVSSLKSAMPKIVIHWDTLEQRYIEAIQSANKLERKHTKTGGIWGK